MTQCTHTKYAGCKPCPCKVTVTFSLDLAYDLAENWKAIDDEDPMIELFEVCREAVEPEREAKERNLYKEFYEASIEIDRLCSSTAMSNEEWNAGQARYAAAEKALTLHNSPMTGSNEAESHSFSDFQQLYESSERANNALSERIHTVNEARIFLLTKVREKVMALEAIADLLHKPGSSLEKACNIARSATDREQ